MRYLLPLLLYTPCAIALDNTVYIDQIGNNNQYTVTQASEGHTVIIDVGRTSDVTGTVYDILQQGPGAKTIYLENTAGINNSFTINQDGVGNHTANIITFAGDVNNIIINQNGIDTHTFTLTGTNTNDGNDITATQTGQSKTFTLNINAISATITVEQTAVIPDTGTMTVNCLTNCGTWSYIRN